MTSGGEDLSGSLVGAVPGISTEMERAETKRRRFIDMERTFDYWSCPAVALDPLTCVRGSVTKPK